MVRRHPPGRSLVSVSLGAVFAIGVTFFSTLALGAVANVTKADADAMLRKIAVITVNGLSSKPSGRRTPVSESELNSFLNIHARPDIPAGVVDPVVVIDEAGRLTGRAIVDLDEVKKAQKAQGFSVLSLLSGRVPVEATGVLSTANGRGQFQLESAWAGGVPIPKALLQQVVSHYSRSATNPSGIDFEAPFDLPVHIREIQTQKGQAIVVQ